MYYGGLEQNLHHLHRYSSVLRVNRGKKGKMRVDQPESWHTVCLTFGRGFNKETICPPNKTL